MSPTGNGHAVSSDTDGFPSLLSPLNQWLTVGAVAALGALTVLDQTPARSNGLLILAAIAGYLLAFVAYMALASLARAGSWLPLIAAWAAGICVTLAMSSWTWRGGLTLAPVIVSALAVGFTARSGRKAAAFWIGAIALVGVMIARDLSGWRDQMDLLREAAPLVARDIVAQLGTFGLAGSTTESIWMGRMITMSWYLPGLLICSALVPFAIGSLWFFERTARLAGENGSSFVRWTMPRILLLLALFGVLGHLVGGEDVRQVSDNCLLGLAIAFAIVGTAAIEYAFRRRSMSVWIRTAIYVALLIAHVYGLIALIAVGIVDTLAGWRREKGARSAGKESVS